MRERIKIKEIGRKKKKIKKKGYEGIDKFTFVEGGGIYIWFKNLSWILNWA